MRVLSAAIMSFGTDRAGFALWVHDELLRPICVYADPERIVAAPNPLVLDAEGGTRFYVIGGAYRWTLHDPQGHVCGGGSIDVATVH